MSKSDSVLLGYAVGSGEPVHIPLRHMVVSGQTQEAGKTTTLEALIARAQLPAVAFITKRGEGSFTNARRIPPYFRERTDWQFVSSLLESLLREKMKFERAWIMKATRGAVTLADVQRNVAQLLLKAKGGMNQDIYMMLGTYLEMVVPRLSKIQFAPSVDIRPGINVIDLSDRETFPPELQGLVMRAVLEWVYENARGTITIIPEAWEFLPEGRGSPVKLAAEMLLRKGATLKNYVWLDSQDIGGIDKATLRHCPVWIVGVQREENEVKRTLGNIPAGTKKPKAADIQRLRRGEFFACHGDHVTKTYVQPLWMNDDDARESAVMLGSASVHVAPSLDRPQHVAPRSDPARDAQNKGHSYSSALAAFSQHAYQENYERGRRDGIARGYRAGIALVEGSLSGLVQSAEHFLADLRALSSKLNQEAPPADKPMVIDPRIDTAAPLPPIAKVIENLRAAAAKPVASHDGAGRKLLAALGSCEKGAAPSWVEVAIVAGMVHSTGHFNGGRKWLRDQGYVVEEGSSVRLSAASKPLPIDCRLPEPTLADIVRLWGGKLGAPGDAMLQFLADHWRNEWVGIDQLSDAIGRKPNNGHWNGGIKALRQAGLIREKSGPPKSVGLNTFLQKLADQ